MRFLEDDNLGDYTIRGYQPGEIKVDNQTHTHSLVISAHRLISDWPPQSLAELKAEHWGCILALQPKVLLLGTGLRFQLPEKSLLKQLTRHNIGVECMDTAAACRTFVALIAEGREVAAALLIR